MGGHRHGRVGKGRKGQEVNPLQFSALALTTGRAWWLSTSARPWPGMCFITGSTPPSMRPAMWARASAITFQGEAIGAGRR